MNKNPVGWFEIYVDNIDRAKVFYESVLEVSLESMGDPNDENIEMMAFPVIMKSYGATGSLVKMEGFPAGGNTTLIYFACEDCAIEESRVAAAGGRMQRPKVSIGEYGFITLASDTEGNMFGLHSLK